MSFFVYHSLKTDLRYTQDQQMHTIRQYLETDLDDVLSAWENANKLAHPFLKADFVDQVRKDIPALYLPNADTWVIEDDFDETAESKVVGFIALMGNEVEQYFYSQNITVKNSVR